METGEALFAMALETPPRSSSLVCLWNDIVPCGWVISWPDLHKGDFSQVEWGCPAHPAALLGQHHRQHHLLATGSPAELPPIIKEASL